jgi:uncharacterized protein YfiM (DUF2279 family)
MTVFANEHLRTAWDLVRGVNRFGCADCNLDRQDGHHGLRRGLLSGSQAMRMRQEVQKMKVLIIGCLLSAGLSMCVKADTLTGQDKAAHFAVSAAVSSLTAKTHGGMTGIGLALLPGLAKELSDLSGSGTPSMHDMAANFAGVLVGAWLPKQYMIAPIAPRGVVEGVRLTYRVEL